MCDPTTLPVSISELVTRVHATPTRLVMAITGGGSRAIVELLEVPGASRTLIEAIIPYSEPSMVGWLGGRPDQFCSEATARAMAMVAFHRARACAPGEKLAGIACTAGLATDRHRRGPDRAHIALQTADRTVSWTLQFSKDLHSRHDEEVTVSRAVLNAVARACDLADRLSIDLSTDESILESSLDAPQDWRDLLLGRTSLVAQNDPSPAVVFPGAFNPQHDGHRQMVQAAQALLGAPVSLEISILNVDKPPLDYLEIRRRLDQFAPGQPLWLTRASTFLEKSQLFPGATFLVGVDTLRRIADPRYYVDATAFQAALDRIAAYGCRFIVFGRDLGTGFVRLADLELPEPLRSICREVPPEQFRLDVSSTAIRRSGAW